MQKTLAHALTDELLAREQLMADYYYASKRIAAMRARAAGMDDALIESLFAIELKPEDRA